METLPPKFFSVRTLIIVLCIATAFMVGAISGRSISGSHRSDAHNDTHPLIRDCTRSHQLINPELDCINADDKFAQIDELQQQLDKEIEQRIATGEIRRASLFYRDLSTGRWFSIHPDISFAPASLLKLPLVVAYYKYAEIDPSVLDRILVFPGHASSSYDTVQTFAPHTTLIPGKSYSIRTLLREMLINSDNDIYMLLANKINTKFFDQVNLDLGVHFPTSGGIEQDFVNTKNYAAILRMLYNATYLSPDNSEAILSILSQTTFDDGIVAGTDRSIIVANKFGERNIRSATSSIFSYQLHDCGIVYFPHKPYILCVMTEGNTQKNLTRTIQDLSRIVFVAIGKKV